MKVAFYILDTTSQLKAWQFSCQLLAKLYGENKSVLVKHSTLDEAQRFENLLWTFREDQFIPHALYQPNEAFPPPIQQIAGELPQINRDVLMNLSNDWPNSLQQFGDVIEIVFSNPAVQQLARERFRQYREQGCDLTTHKLSEAEM